MHSPEGTLPPPLVSSRVAGEGYLPLTPTILSGWRFSGHDSLLFPRAEAFRRWEVSQTSSSAQEDPSRSAAAGSRRSRFHARLCAFVEARGREAGGGICQGPFVNAVALSGQSMSPNRPAGVDQTPPCGV